ncbi:MAG TPA: hypothetical protein VGB73_02455 [Pyrinomonadaceae bacterium]|jgi:hypothetical protein
MIVVASKPGQLANLLFLSAQFIACARENHFTLVNPAFEDYARYFETTRRDLFCRYPPRESMLPATAALRKILYRTCYYAARVLVRSRVETRFLRAIALDWEERFNLGDAEFRASLAARRQLIFAQGWLFRDDEAVSRQAGEVRKFFEPLAEHRERVASLVAEARGGADVLVGVHIRQGDYRTHLGGRYFYELEVYASLMERVAATLGAEGRRVRFLICSNEPQEGDALSRLSWTAGTGHLVEDLYALAACDYILGPPSTFTMWASFYGEVPLYFVEDPERTPRTEDFVVCDPASFRSPTDTGIVSAQAGREAKVSA